MWEKLLYFLGGDYLYDYQFENFDILVQLLFWLCLIWVIYLTVRVMFFKKRLSKWSWVGLFLVLPFMYSFMMAYFKAFINIGALGSLNIFECPWHVTVLVMFVLGIVWITFLLVRVKFCNKRLSKQYWASIALSLFLMYQIIPAGLHYKALYCFYKGGDSFKYENLAIKTALFPIQKSVYSYGLGDMYWKISDVKNALVCYDRAKKYYDVWRVYTYYRPVYIHLFDKLECDKIVELSKEVEKECKDNNYEACPSFHRAKYDWLSACYILKGDYKNSVLYFDKYFEDYKTRYGLSVMAWPTLAEKAYFEKRKGNIKEAEKYYKKALEVNNCTSCVDKINSIYEDYPAYVQNKNFFKRLHALDKEKKSFLE